MIVVTGGAGFIGSNIAQELSKKYRVVICDKLNDSIKKKNIGLIQTMQVKTLILIDCVWEIVVYPVMNHK